MIAARFPARACAAFAGSLHVRAAPRSPRSWVGFPAACSRIALRAKTSNEGRGFIRVFP